MKPSADLAAGLTVGVMLIPQGMAYAMLAGLPPVYGLYAALAPLVIYALLGTSRHLSVGPVAMDSLLIASGIAPLAAGDPERYVSLALLLAAMVGSLQIVLGLVRAGFLVNLLSRPVLAGFTSAVALVIGASQLGNLLGISIRSGRVHEIILSAASQLDSAHRLTVLIGLGAILAGTGLKRWFPRLPGAILLVGLGTLVSWASDMGSQGVQIVGAVPSGLPVPTLPATTWADLASLLPVAFAISLVGYMEAIAVAKVYSSRHRYRVDPNQELKALGAANLIGSIFQSFPVTGGFSRTAVNEQAGARSQLSSLVSAGVIAITLLFLTPLFHDLPNAILAAIIVTAVLGLIDVKVARELWRVDRRDFGLMLATFCATLMLGIREGIILGAGLSMAVVLEQIARPHTAILGRIAGTRQYRNVVRNPGAILEEGIGILRMDASLFYGNAEAFKDAALAAFESTAPATATDPTDRFLVLDAYPMNRADSTGLQAVRELIEEIRSESGSLYLASVKGPLADKLLAGGIVELVGPENIFREVWQAVEAARQARDEGRVEEPLSGEIDVPARIAPKQLLDN